MFAADVTIHLRHLNGVFFTFRAERMPFLKVQHSDKASELGGAHPERRHAAKNPLTASSLVTYQWYTARRASNGPET
jgi:hypothetical protein